MTTYSRENRKNWPSKMSTILKNAKDREDLPLPVRPQIPTCKKWKVSHFSQSTYSLTPYLHLQFFWESCTGLCCWWVERSFPKAGGTPGKTQNSTASIFPFFSPHHEDLSRGHFSTLTWMPMTLCTEMWDTLVFLHSSVWYTSKLSAI